MKLSQLEYFQTICKHCNLTRAAEELHVSQPSLTHVIHDLEQEFGLTLFLRQNKGLVLTEEGRQFLDETNRLLEQTNYFVSRMKILGQSNQVVHFDFLLPVQRSFSADHPSAAPAISADQGQHRGKRKHHEPPENSGWKTRSCHDFF